MVVVSVFIVDGDGDGDGGFEDNFGDGKDSFEFVVLFARRFIDRDA